MCDKIETNRFNDGAPSLTRLHFHPREPHILTAGEQGQRLIYRYFRCRSRY